MKLKYKAVLFDFDGVIAETMEDLFLAWKNSFLKYGIEIKKEDYFPLEGTKVIEVAKIISKKYNLITNPEDIVKSKNEYYLKNYNFAFYPNIDEIIDNLGKKNIKIAIVSASPREKIAKTVKKEFLDKFDAIVCEEDYKNGKPAKDPYFNALKKLGLNPDEAIAIENAPLGIKSAKNAGIFCIGITTTVNAEALKDADLIIKDHEGLKKFLF